MIVLHGSWLEGALHLWAERWSTDAAARPSAPSGSGPPLSPNDPGEDGLLAAWRKIPDAPLDHDFAERTAWLPSTAGRPVHSREVWRFSGKAAAGPTLSPWQVTTLPLSWRAQFALFNACCGHDFRLAPGVAAGADLRVWDELFRLAGALTARAAFLPALVDCGGRYESRWQPAFDGADRHRLFALAARLPAAARCLVMPGAPAPAASAPDLAGAFVSETLDRLVRFAAATTLSRAHAARGRYSSAHDAWIASLRGDSRAVRWDRAGELSALAAEVENWRRPVDLAARADYRLLLRLEEPVRHAPDRWFLRCLIQPFAHPTDVRPLATAGGEFALTSLGQAALLYPPLGRGNGTQDATAGCTLTTGEAHEFLTVYAPLLEAAGFGVATPAEWHGADRRPRLELLAQARDHAPAEPGRCSLASLVSVNWQVVLGGEPVGIEEIEELRRGGEKLVRFRGRWIEFDGRQADEALRLLRRRKGESRAAGDLIRLMIGVDQDAHGLRVGGVAAQGWLRELAGRMRGETALEELPAPRGFRGELRPYQRQGFAWLAFLRGWRLGACLADDMGLGKTVQALALLARERECGETRPVLLVCPSSVIGNWQREAARFTPDLTVLRHHGPERLFGEAFAEEAGRHALVVTNYALLPRDYATLRRVAWAGVILDEAQNVKNPDTRQSQAARALPADYRLALTGTPVENHVGDLWSIMDFLNPGLLGSHATFRDRFLRPIQSGVDPAARERLRRVTAPFVLRRLKTDRAIIADLPEKIEGKVYCPLTREQAALYATALRELEAGLSGAEGIARRGLVLATLTRLKQICNHPLNYLGGEEGRARPPQNVVRASRLPGRTAAGTAAPLQGNLSGGPALPETADLPDDELAGRSGKLERLTEMLEEVIDSGDRALVFTQFARMGGLLQRHLGQAFGFEPLFLHGGVALPERDRMLAAFQEADGPPVFVLSLRAGGTGINLARASHVFHFDRWWNPAVENQATDRAFRIGQTRNVLVHKFICAGTLEDRIDALIESKRAVAEDVVGSGEAWLTELSDDELKAALALAPETVVAEEGEGVSAEGC